MSTPRRYSSSNRRRQAEENRQRILSAARDLMTEKGFDGATIAEIARAAGVSAQTVYAVFGSKKGILAELMDNARFDDDYLVTVRTAKETTDPVQRLRLVAAIARRVLDAERSEMHLLHGAAAVSPELAAIGQEKEQMRFEQQAPVIDVLVGSGRLKAGLDVATARDILWTLSGRETYRMLVIERGWSSERYEAWLAELLVEALLRD
ncbi:helix-turn-helix domain-containing protein [Nocardia sp. NPDC046763]|uniref:TetR/AcrR family transcriptional regulator n=1 Tax=Nocardia sp. NPDC046763 TaxID=3155256 RepID=UPI0033F6B030